MSYMQDDDALTASTRTSIDGGKDAKDEEIPTISNVYVAFDDDVLGRKQELPSDAATLEEEDYLPRSTVYEGGALRDGGAASLFSREYVGLAAQYACVGLIDSILPSTIYPFLHIYLNLPGAQTTTAQTLVGLPWSFKVFYGSLSDCFPIRGYRRRPYMMLGWSISISMLILMGMTPVGKPYFTDPQYRFMRPDEYTPEVEATLNRDAALGGAKYVIMMMLCAFGYLMANVSADGAIVELAQREPIAVRGTIQSRIYVIRTISNVLGLVVVSFAFNGRDYGGEFEFSLSFPTLMFILGCVIAPVLPLTWFCIRETQYPRVRLRSYLRVLWTLIQKRVFYQVIANQFFSGIFQNFSFTSRYPIQFHWARVSPMNERVGGLIANGIFAASIYGAGRFGLDWDWRVMPVITMVCYVVIDAICTMCTVWDVVRHQWFWLGLPLIEQIPLGINFIVSSFIVVELAVEGHEAAIYGLLTTVMNMSVPFASAITKNLNSLFDLSTERIQNDSYEVRRDVTITICAMYAMNLLSLLWLVLLPRQKQAVHVMLQIGGSSRFMGKLTICYLVFAFVWSVVTNIMGIFPETACLTVAGGDGCE